MWRYAAFRKICHIQIDYIESKVYESERNRAQNWAYIMQKYDAEKLRSVYLKKANRKLEIH